LKTFCERIAAMSESAEGAASALNHATERVSAAPLKCVARAATDVRTTRELTNLNVQLGWLIHAVDNLLVARQRRADEAAAQTKETNQP
jgi:hypothetical protein